MSKVKTTLENKHHWKSYMDTEYIGGHSLADMDAIVTITKTNNELVKSKENPNGEKNFIVYVKDSKSEQKFVLNMTNGLNITNALGTPDPEKWVGRKIQLYTAKVNAFGKDHDALRVRDVAPVDADIDVSGNLAKLKKCKTLSDLQKVYKSLDNWKHPDVVELKDQLKTKLK